MLVKLVTTKEGFALWERGGSDENNCGEAVVVCGPRGERLAPMATTSETNGNHALLPVEVGCHIFVAYRLKDRLSIFLYRITEIAEGCAWCELIARFNDNRWDAELPYWLVRPAMEVIGKIFCVECQEPYYIQE